MGCSGVQTIAFHSGQSEHESKKIDGAPEGKA